MRFLSVVLTLALALGSPALAAGQGDVGKQPPGTFDYYVLSMSWVPGFCATNKSDPGECSKGFGFALHGLWPEFKGGSYPTGCSSVALSAADEQQFGGIYASQSLIEHEWPKHGTCSGLPPAQFFNLSASDFHRVVIPPDYQQPVAIRSADAGKLKQALLAANAGMPASGIRTVANHGVVTEVDICLTKAGGFQSC